MNIEIRITYLNIKMYQANLSININGEPAFNYIIFSFDQFCALLISVLDKYNNNKCCSYYMDDDEEGILIVNKNDELILNMINQDSLLRIANNISNNDIGVKIIPNSIAEKITVYHKVIFDYETGICVIYKIVETYINDLIKFGSIYKLPYRNAIPYFNMYKPDNSIIEKNYNIIKNISIQSLRMKS